MSYIAFFDLDKTILKINSGRILFHKSYKMKILSKMEMSLAFLLALLNKLQLLDPLKIIELFPARLLNYPVKEFERLCAEMVEEDLLKHIWPQMIEEIEMHKKQGAKLVMLSATISLICTPIAKHLGFDEVICSELATKDGMFSGKTVRKLCFREEKLVRLNEYFDSVNHFKKEDCYYYGDSIDDLPVLESVGFPVCVNPDKRLARIADDNNWMVHRLF